MSMVQQAIEVGAPLHAVYQQLAAFEHDPRFQITERSLDERVSWSATDGPVLAETITLRPIDAGRTQVMAQLEADLDAALPSDQHAQQTLSRRLQDDLMSFKGQVEGASRTTSVLTGASSKQLAGGAGFGNGVRPGMVTPASVAARIRRSGQLAGNVPAAATTSGSAAMGGRAPARDLTGDGVINETDRGGADNF